MPLPRFPAVLDTAAAGLAAMGDAPVWLTLAFVLPGLLSAAVRALGETLTGISRFRTEAMRRRHEDRLLGTVTDVGTGLDHLERVQREAATAASESAPLEPANSDPPSGSPP
ncbi:MULTISPECIES: hypothetical protein [Streptomyces]|uniref:Uncharacterized protein n=1 Tax=Streptomyces sviceus (strain ATCC 29083 / DSM 924 / JCM 4929 / NBRC 13980 / NCIMB 11184 / NRRL 5439 / UC 5370) TaxID=463191 RepID=B5HS83_STRX2|nr:MULTISPECIES: hypothetical protein [Streptomyces]EDY55688.1 conserved hypothetical protein [Streptomyces sviceus ATCC 29083]MYT03103.1 hypothetical protein [Streptomyces sp. SID5470]